jgi:hypothetical protein
MPDVSEHIVSHGGRQWRRGHHVARRILHGDNDAECDPHGLDGPTPQHHSAQTGIWPPCKAVIGSVTDGTVRLSSSGHVVQSPIRSRQRLRKGLIEAGCRRWPADYDDAVCPPRRS